MRTSISKIIATSILIGAVCCFADAQTTVKSISNSKKYSELQIKSILGSPLKFKKQMGDYGEEFWTFYYSDANFIFEDGYLFEFGIKTKKYPVMTDKVSGGVKVGDNISKVLKVKDVEYWKPDNDNDCYIINFKGNVCADYIFYVNNDIIKDIAFFTHN